MRKVSAKIDSSFFRFCITGILATSIHVISVSILIPTFRVDVGVSNGIGFVLATVFSSLVNTRWSFKVNLSYKTALRFWIVATFGCFLSILISKTIESMGFHYLIGVAAITMTVPIISYTLHHRYTYNSRPP